MTKGDVTIHIEPEEMEALSHILVNTYMTYSINQKSKKFKNKCIKMLLIIFQLALPAH